MAPQRRSTARRTTQPARKRVWARRNFSDASLTTTVETFDLLSDFTGELGITATLPGTTIGGILMDYHIFQQAEAGAADTDALFMGIRVSQEATLSTVDGPLAEQHADWMWYQMFGGSASGVTDGLSYSSARDLGGPVHIRAKRRMDEMGMKLTVSFEAVGAATYSIRLSTSVLLLLP